MKSMTPESMKGVTQNIVSLGLEDTDSLPSANGVKVELKSFQDFPGKPTMSLEIGELDDGEYVKMPRRQIWVGGDAASCDISSVVENGKRIFEIKNPYKVLCIAVIHKMDHLGYCTTELNGIDGIRTLAVKKRNKSNFLDAQESQKYDQYVAGKGTITVELTFGKSINKGTTASQAPSKSTATSAPAKAPQTAPKTSTPPTQSVPAAKTTTAPTKKPIKCTVEVVSYQGFKKKPCIWYHYGAFWPKYEKPGVRGGGTYDGQTEGANERQYPPGELVLEIPAGDWEDQPFFGYVLCHKAMYAICYCVSPIDGIDGERTLPCILRKKENWSDQEAANFDKHGAANASMTVRVKHAF